ncbi:hypothetical protein D1007_37737 [Hordeum vulgare]|nr:hypothetical protein D1007_37737 [Hordeum vulgare]
MGSEPTSLAVLMAKADKYATADSTMRVKVTASNKVVPTPSTPKPVGDNRGGQYNKRKVDQLDSRSASKQVANMEEEAPAAQGGSQRKRTGKNTWQPKLTFEQMLDAPCKMHIGAKPTTHSLQQCSFAQRLSQGEGLPAPPAAATSHHAPAPGLAPAPQLSPPNDGRLHDHCNDSAGYNCYAGYNDPTGYNCCAGYNGVAGYNVLAGSNNNISHANPRILSAQHPVGGRHGGRPRAGWHDGTRDRRSRACNHINKRGGFRSS